MHYQYSDNISTLKASAIREIFKYATQPGFISFSAGNPAVEAFPSKAVGEITSKIMQDEPVLALQYSVTEGYTPLRDEVKKLCKERYNIVGENDDVIITSGAQQVMDLSTKVLCDSGDTVIVEEPSFIGSLNCFRSYGLRLKGIPVEKDGMNMEALEEALITSKNVRFIYTIPNFQNPSGVTMSLEKRHKVYELARKYNVIIIEDNPYGELRFKGEDIPSIKSFDTDGLVIYAGSFSKILSPGLRLGYTVAPAEIVKKMIICKQTTDVHTAILPQLIAYHFMTDYDFIGHVESLKYIYKKKAELMLECIEKKLCPKGVTYFDVDGGLFIWCTLPEDVDMLLFCTAAARNKVGVVPGTAFLSDLDVPCQSFRLNYSSPSDEQIIKGIDILADLL